MSKKPPKKKSMKGGELQLNEELLFNMALQIMECTTNFALTHETVIEKVSAEQGVTDELVSMLRKNGADLFHEHRFERGDTNGDIIYPL